MLTKLTAVNKNVATDDHHHPNHPLATPRTTNMMDMNDDDDDDKKAPAGTHLLELSNDLLLYILQALPPKDMSNLLQTHKSISKLACSAWKYKVLLDHPKNDEFSRQSYDGDDKKTCAAATARSSNVAVVVHSEAHFWREELEKRYQRMYCYRPVVRIIAGHYQRQQQQQNGGWNDRSSSSLWRGPVHYNNYYPEPTSPFHAVQRVTPGAATGVTTNDRHVVRNVVRFKAKTERLGCGTYQVSWRVKVTADSSVSFVLQLYTEFEDGYGETRQSIRSMWNSRMDTTTNNNNNGSGEWKNVNVRSDFPKRQQTITIGPQGGRISAQMSWETTTTTSRSGDDHDRDDSLDLTIRGGAAARQQEQLLVDYLKVKKIK